MNNDVPETLAAARSRAADLEQQLKLSDEGVSRLAPVSYTHLTLPTIA